MIVQTASENSAHFVIEQADHARLSGEFAALFGNEKFAPVDPKAEIVYITAHHDEGWVPVDSLYEQSPQTGLPHHLNATPLPYLLQTSAGSPAFNEKYHPLCGILSSMHTYGLFHGRYGLSDFVFIDKVAEEHKAAMVEMLEHELERQARLKSKLRENSDTAPWAEEDFLFKNYKLLQFFDTLALYFHMSHVVGRAETEFQNVPDGKGNDLTLKILHLPDGKYGLAPWPFSASEIGVVTPGRYLTPQPPGTDFAPIFASTPKVVQQYILTQLPII